MDSETRRAARSVYDCLLLMGQQQSNPVMQLFEPDQTVIENRKYPPGLLQFDGGKWRAYYHCHPESGHGRSGKHHFDNEHGHFHIFVRVAEQPDAWSHLVALSIDPMGQPLGWFTVNHWVTGEQWYSADGLTAKLNKNNFEEQKDLLQRWLLSMLALDKEQIGDLLQQRDEMLNRAGEDKRSACTNRGLYILSENYIDLEGRLSAALEIAV